nr:hypothetical protein [Nostoc sp. DedSLP05]MDZ8100867.1 hypothetical protein [Nostoc sp. DedSLP01]
MTHLPLRNKNFFEHFEVTTQADSSSNSSVNHALIVMAQEVAELLKQAYPIQADETDYIELTNSKCSSQSLLCNSLSVSKNKIETGSLFG